MLATGDKAVLPHVAVCVDEARNYDRKVLQGIADYAETVGRWSIMSAGPRLCPPGRRPSISGAATAPVRTCLPIASWRSTPRPGSANGTSNSCITIFGTAICLLPRCCAVFAVTAQSFPPSRRSPSRGMCGCFIARPANRSSPGAKNPRHARCWRAKPPGRPSRCLRPEPFSRQRFTEDEVTDRTPAAREAVLARLRVATLLRTGRSRPAEHRRTPPSVGPAPSGPRPLARARGLPRLAGPRPGSPSDLPSGP